MYFVHTQCEHCGRIRRIPKIAVGESAKCPDCGCASLVKSLPASRDFPDGPEATSSPKEVKRFATKQAAVEAGLPAIAWSSPEIVIDDSSGLTPLGDSSGLAPLGDADAPTELLSPATPGGAADPLAETAALQLGASALPAVAASDNVACPAKLGRFEILDVLGKGGFGVVYRAYDPFLEREVALKAPSDTDRNSPRVKRFMREARSAARLKHPHIVAVFEAGETDGRFYIASEFVEGKPLSTRIAEQPPHREQAVTWVRDLALALAYAHGEGIVHRDVKPGNVILSQHGRPQLTDFGLSKRLDLGDGEDSVLLTKAEWGGAKRPGPKAGGATADLTIDGDLMGTPAYMSPEQARGEHSLVGPLSDQYSLGVMLYELLTGQRPFVGSAVEVLEKVAYASPPPVRKLRPDVPLRLEQICSRAMNRDPAQRFADCGELAVALQQWLKEARVGRPNVESAPNRTEQPTDANVAGFGLMGLCAAIGALLGAAYNIADPSLWASATFAQIFGQAATGSIAPLVGLLFGGLLGLAIHLKRS